MINVLVFPCGSEIGLEVYNALKYDKHINLFGLSSAPCHGKVVYKNYIEGISFITSDSFIDELNELCDKNNIDVIIPAYDDVILYLSDNRDRLHAKLVTSSSETCYIARSKIRTYELFKDYDFIPKSYSIDEVSEKDLPLFAKPDIGQGSQGAFKVTSLEDLDIIKNQSEEYVISEMLPGEEYTVDCFTDRDRNILAASMRMRRRIKGGISVNTVSVKLPEEVKYIAEKINSRLEFDGVWFFQVKLDNVGKYKLLELAPRVAGSMSLSRVKGFNYILNSVYQTMGYKVKAIPQVDFDVEEDRALSNVFIIQVNYDVVYLDFDDTVYYGEKKDMINIDVISFIYQCMNKGKKVKLLTRHSKNIYESLDRFHIDKSLFFEIINIDEDKKKSDYITDKSAIFIDDSFRERLDVSERCHIPVFDMDCVSALIDRRV